MVSFRIMKKLELAKISLLGQSFPTRPYQMNFAKNRNLEAFDGLLDVMGRRFSPHGSLMFDRSGFSKGFTILAANLAPSGAGRGSLGLIKQGNLSLSLTFERPLPNTIMVLSLRYLTQCSKLTTFANLSPISLDE